MEVYAAGRECQVGPEPPRPAKQRPLRKTLPRRALNRFAYQSEHVHGEFGLSPVGLPRCSVAGENLQDPAVGCDAMRGRASLAGGGWRGRSYSWCTGRRTRLASDRNAGREHKTAPRGAIATRRSVCLGRLAITSPARVRDAQPGTCEPDAGGGVRFAARMYAGQRRTAPGCPQRAAQGE